MPKKVTPVPATPVFEHKKGIKVDPATGQILMDERGHEVPDPTPIAPPVGYVKQESLFAIVRRQVLAHNRMVQEADQYETPEEAEDFDVGDDFDPDSPWEENFDLHPTTGFPSLQDAPEAPGQPGNPADGKQPSPKGKPAKPEEPKAPSPSPDGDD